MATGALSQVQVLEVQVEVVQLPSITSLKKTVIDGMTDVGRIHSSYDKLHGAGSHTRMTENEFRVLRLHPNLDDSDMNKLLDIARTYDMSARRNRIVHDLQVTKHKERQLGQ